MNMEEDMDLTRTETPVAVLQAQILAAYTLETKKLRAGPLRGLHRDEFGDALAESISYGFVKQTKTGFEVTKRGLSLLKHR